MLIWIATVIFWQPACKINLPLQVDDLSVQELLLHI